MTLQKYTNWRQMKNEAQAEENDFVIEKENIFD